MARAEEGRAKGHRQESKLALYSAYGGAGPGGGAIVEAT